MKSLRLPFARRAARSEVSTPLRIRAFGVVAIYAALASLWILLSDRIAGWLVRDPDLLTTVGMVKGGVFVVVSSVLLYWLVRGVERQPGSPLRWSGALRRPLLLLLALVGAVVLAAILSIWQSQVRSAQAQLRSIGELQARSIGDGVADLLAEASLVAELGAHGADGRAVDRPTAPKLVEALDAYRRHSGVSAVILLDRQGRELWHAAAEGAATQLQAGEGETGAGAGGERAVRPRLVGPWGDAQGHAWLDILAPLAEPAADPRSPTRLKDAAPGTVVLRHEVRRWLTPLVGPWQDGPQKIRLTLLSLPREGGEAAAAVASPAYAWSAQPSDSKTDASMPEILASPPPPWALEPTLRPDADWVVGEQGRKSLAYVRDIPGTPWRLATELDRSALFERASQDMVWTAMAGLLLLGLAAGGVLVLRQNQELARTLSERSRQAEKLKALDLLDAIASSSADVIFAKDLEGRYMFFNPEAERITGLTAAEVIGHDDHLLFPPAEAAMLRARDRRVAELGQTFIGEESLTTALGPKVHLITVSPLRDASGAIIGICGLGRDITERRRAERALRDNEALLAQAQRIAGVGHYRLDVASGLWSGSTLLDEIFGLRPEDVHDVATWIGLIHPDDRARMAMYFQQKVLAARRRFDAEYRIVHQQTGTLRWVHGLGRLEMDSSGTPVRMIGTIQDITERRQHEESLHKLSRVVEQSPESIVITDLDARIEYVNEAFERSSGYARDEVMGRNPRFLRGSTEVSDELARLWPTLLQGESWRGTLQTRRKDGSLFTELAVISPIRQADGRTTHYVAVKEDITEKQRLNEELERHRHHLEDLVQSRTRELAEARARAEAASRAKSSFLANMSHEIRTPLNAILGLARLVRRNGLDVQQVQRLDKLDAAADHLMEVISDILDFSKIEAGHLQIDESPFLLGDLLGGVRDLVQAQAQAKGLRLRIEAPEGQRWVLGDQGKLRQALLNFAGNAVKFTASGEIVLRVVAQQPCPDTVGALWPLRFEVQDSGVGMPPEVLARVFGAFEQADVSTSRRFGGTGLGLSIARGLAQAMGGEAGAQSEVGWGSVFWLTVTLRTAAPEAEPGGKNVVPGAPEARLRQRARAPRILLAEDHDINREVACELLRAAGCEVIEARDGAEAVARARRMHPDLILMDMQMPGMDGLEAARLLRGIEGIQVPMIALTANALAEDRQACLDAGMDDFIVKPVDPDTLLATLLRWLPEEQQAPATPESGAALDAGPMAVPEVTASASTATALDLDAALAMVGGQMPLLRRLLQIFVDKHAGDGPLLQSMARARGWSELQQRVHAMRGAAGHLRLHAVQVHAQTLEVALREGRTHEVDTPLEELVRALDAAVLEIRIYLGSPAAGESPSVAPVFMAPTDS